MRGSARPLQVHTARPGVLGELLRILWRLRMKTPVNVAITGAAGQIGYALAFRVASGQMLGRDQPVNLHLLEITPALGRAAGRRHGAQRLRVPDPELRHRDR